MKIHYNEEFNCFETTECHKTNNIELDGVQLIPITELEKMKEDFCDMRDGYPRITDETLTVRDVIKVIDSRIYEPKGEKQ